MRAGIGRCRSFTTRPSRTRIGPQTRRNCFAGFRSGVPQPSEQGGAVVSMRPVRLHFGPCLQARSRIPSLRRSIRWVPNRLVLAQTVRAGRTHSQLAGVHRPEGHSAVTQVGHPTSLGAVRAPKVACQWWPSGQFHETDLSVTSTSSWIQRSPCWTMFFGSNTLMLLTPISRSVQASRLALAVYMKGSGGVVPRDPSCRCATAIPALRNVRCPGAQPPGRRARQGCEVISEPCRHLIRPCRPAHPSRGR